MNTLPLHTQFESVLKKQHLADAAAAFGDPEFFDEIPLYSRYKQVDFLKQHGDVNLLLMDLALDYLDRVISAIPVSDTERLVAITVIRDNDEYIVPSIFVCNGGAKTQLKTLRLSGPSQGLGKQIKALVKSSHRETAYSILEDRETVPGDVRVFVGHKSPPLGLLRIETFATSAGIRSNGKKKGLTARAWRGRS
jgi:hypothetical protein